MYVIKSGKDFVSEITRGGLVLLTSKLDGYPVHPTMRKVKGERCSQAMIFPAKATAEGFIRKYEAMKLPRGFNHCQLRVVKVQ